jgi:hypothetical protein
LTLGRETPDGVALGVRDWKVVASSVRKTHPRASLARGGASQGQGSGPLASLSGSHPRSPPDAGTAQARKGSNSLRLRTSEFRRLSRGKQHCAPSAAMSSAPRSGAAIVATRWRLFRAILGAEGPRRVASLCGGRGLAGDTCGLDDARVQRQRRTESTNSVPGSSRWTASRE